MALEFHISSSVSFQCGHHFYQGHIYITLHISSTYDFNYIPAYMMYILLVLPSPSEIQPPTKQFQPEFNSDSHKEPSLGSLPSSKINSKKVNSLTTTGGIYSHWFALQLYNLTKSCVYSTSGPTQVNICGISMQIKSSAVERIVESYQSVSKMHSHPAPRQGRGIICNADFATGRSHINSFECSRIR